ncbi:MAG: alpha/beta fold hydrolase [Actinomycetota bacterium]
MGKYVELNGLRTWYDEHGEGEPLVMLHPGGIDSGAFGPNLKVLASRFHVFLPERRGHGHTPDGDAPYSYELMAQDTIHFLEQVVGGSARLLGMSDGGVVALLVAHKRPDLVRRLICAGSVFNNNGWIPGAIDPIIEPPEFMIESYKELSPDGIEHLPAVVKKMNEMHTNGPKLTEKDLKNIRCRTLVMIGDDDEVTLEHATLFYRGLPNGELAVVPGTSHGLLVEKPDLCNKIMLDFMTLDPVPTFAPIRRA